MSTSTILRGTMLLTAGMFISKLLGMFYVIPFNWMVGEVGSALFYFAYNPYNILLSISIVGVPKAVSKFVAKYNALGDYDTSRRMFKSGMGLMAVTGFAGFLILFLCAEPLAKQMLADDDIASSVDEVKMVIRMVSFALIIIPGMSIVRGFFQGNESMGPTALSQLIEQIARIVFLLLSVYLIIYVYQGSIALAVGFATFGTFIGGLASCVVLYIYWQKRKPHLDKMLNQQRTFYNIPISNLFKELFRYAGPFVLVGIATSLYQLVDQFTFNQAMVDIGYTGEYARAVQGSFNFLSHKLVIIPVTLAIGLSLAMLPAMTKSFIEKNRPVMFHQMNQSLQIIILFVFPAEVGLLILSHEAYGALYGISDNIEVYGSLLAWYAPVGIFFALFTVTSNILQGIDRQKFTIISLSIGLFLKMVLNVPFIHWFDAKGAIIATLLAVASVVISNLWEIKRAVHFPFKQLFKRSMLIAIFTTMMAISVLLVKWLLGYFVSYTDGQLQATFILAVSVIVGLIVYLSLCYYSTLLERVIGNRVRVLDKFLKR